MVFPASYVQVVFSPSFSQTRKSYSLPVGSEKGTHTHTRARMRVYMYMYMYIYICIHTQTHKLTLNLLTATIVATS